MTRERVRWRGWRFASSQIWMTSMCEVPWLWIGCTLFKSILFSASLRQHPMVKTEPIFTHGDRTKITTGYEKCGILIRSVKNVVCKQEQEVINECKWKQIWRFETVVRRIDLRLTGRQFKLLWKIRKDDQHKILGKNNDIDGKIIPPMPKSRQRRLKLGDRVLRNVF